MNVKISMLLCLGFIIGVAWLINRVGPATSQAASPVTNLATATERPLGRSEPGESTRLRFHRETALAQNKPAVPIAGNPLPAPSLRSAPRGETALPPLVITAEPSAVTGTADLEDEPVVINRGGGGSAPRGPAPRTDTAPPPHGVTERVVTSPPKPDDRPAPDVRPSGGRSYTVKKGDSLARIAKAQLGSGERDSIERIIALNPKLSKRPNVVYLGEELILPDAGDAGTVLAERAVEKAPPEAPRTQPRGTKPTAEKPRPPAPAAPESPAVVNADKNSPKNARNTKDASKAAPRKNEVASGGKATKNSEPRYYTVKPNDSLRAIALRELKDAGRWREIASLNKLKGETIVAGQKLKLPGSVQVARGR